MKNIFKTTGLLSIAVWIAFFIIGVVGKRPLICGISGLFLIFAVYRRSRILKRENSAKTLWRKFTADKQELVQYPYQIWKFNDDGEYRKNIIARILDGEVRGESYSLDYFEANGQPLPKEGQYNVVCDSARQAYAVVRTIKITPVAFRDVTPELARLEGCSNVSQWRRFNLKKYQNLCDRMEVVFSEEIPLIFEEFEVVFTLSEKEGK